MRCLGSLSLLPTSHTSPSPYGDVSVSCCGVVLGPFVLFDQRNIVSIITQINLKKNTHLVPKRRVTRRLGPLLSFLRV